VRVPADFLLGPEGKGFTQFLRILDGGRIGVAALGLGLAQGAFEQALRYANERTQFGKPIAGYQAMAFKLANMAADIELCRLVTYKAAWLKDQGLDFTQTAAIAKLKTGVLAREVANLSLQIHGGYGYMDEFPISRFYRDAKILEIGEGTNEIQQMVIARGLGIKLH
jgi:alkylation response protein AidB-like acyl-CoA dehydrogenase